MTKQEELIKFVLDIYPNSGYDIEEDGYVRFSINYKYPCGYDKRILDFTHKQLTSIPDCFSVLRCHELWLDNNYITEIPESLVEADIMYFEICSNRITKLPSYLKDFNTKMIMLLDNPIAKEDIKHIGHIQNIRTEFGYNEEITKLCISNERRDKLKTLLK